MRAYNNLIIIIIGVIIGMTLPISAYSETLESTDYLIKGASLNSGGEPVDSGSANYSLFSTIGEFSGSPRVSSASYELRSGVQEVFLANTPRLNCFETDTDGSSNCTTGPSYLNSNGMRRVCGPAGCYNRARFEIDTQNNPDDTLYALQISSNDFATISYIDGITFRPVSVNAKEITDYKTKTSWESTTLNIRGLDSDTTYKLRAVALHGDFTESEPGPSLTATTALATIEVDLDITDEAETTPETPPPHEIEFTGDYRLIRGAASVKAPDLIWLDIETNANYGVALVQRSQNGGLYSALNAHTINSASANLGSAADGFGIQLFTSSQIYHTGSGNGELGEITGISPYNGSGDNVGILQTSFNRVVDSDKPLDTGRLGLYVKAKASSSTPVGTDYTDDIIFVAVGRY